MDHLRTCPGADTVRATRHRRLMRIAGLTCLAITTLALAASAGPAFAEAPGRARVSLGIVAAPVGSYTVRGFGLSGSGDTEPAFALRPAIDFSLSDYVFIGFSLQYVMNVNTDGLANANVDASKALDLLARVGAHAPVADVVHLFGYVAPGYSIIYPPNDGNKPQGFVLAASGGALFSVGSRAFLTGEIGYQWGFQELTIANTDFDANLNYLLLSLGLGIKL